MKRRSIRKKTPARKASAPPRQDRKALVLIVSITFALLVGAAGFRTFLTSHHHAAIGGPYALTDGQGHPVSQSNFQGRYTLIYFGYTHCVDVCPLTLETVSSALDELKTKGNSVTPIFISVDPTRDTPKVVKEYVENFSPKIIGLTGTSEQLQPVMEAFHVKMQHHSGMGSDDLIDHSSLLYLMDGENQLVGMIPVDSSAHQIATDLKRLLLTHS